MRIILLALLVSFGVGACARLDDTPRRRTAEGLLQVVPTWKSISETNVVMQGFDYSCGAAALATLLKHYFGDAVTETDILRDILAHLDKKTLEERKEDGLSLLDLKEYAERHGYQAAGVRLKPDALPTLKGPILVYLETPEFRHFAILRGVREDRVYVADPARGNVRQPVDRFLDEWSGLALVLGKSGFGTPQDTDLALDLDVPVRPEVQAARRALYPSLRGI
jgi:uncharacterized protein